MDILEEIVLLTIYIEYQKDTPQMQKITNNILNKLNISYEKFTNTLKKLENDGLITGTYFVIDGKGNTHLAYIKGTRPTINGIIYVETIVNIKYSK